LYVYYNYITNIWIICSSCFLVLSWDIARDAGTMWRQRGADFRERALLNWYHTKRCLQNIGSWTSPNHVFYLLDDRGVRGFSARRLCYSWTRLEARWLHFLPFLKQIRKRIALTFLTIRYFAKATLYIERAPFPPPCPSWWRATGAAAPPAPPPVPASLNIAYRRRDGCETH
jgi:hypothetical protein